MQNSVIDFIISDELHEDMKHSEEYKRLSDESYAIYEQAHKQLTAKQFEIFNKFAELSMGVESEASEAYFKEGFKMGVRLAVECLTKV